MNNKFLLLLTTFTFFASCREGENVSYSNSISGKVQHSYSLDIFEQSARKYMPNDIEFSILNLSDSLTGLNVDFDVNNSPSVVLKIDYPDGLVWEESAYGDLGYPYLGLNQQSLQLWYDHFKPKVKENDEIEVKIDLDGVPYHISPRKKFCVSKQHSYRHLSNFIDLSINSPKRLPVDSDINQFVVPISNSQMDQEFYQGVLSVKKSFIDSICTFNNEPSTIPEYLLQDETESYSMTLNDEGYYSLIFQQYAYGGTQYKSAGWLKVGTSKFQLPKFNGQQYVWGRIYECRFYSDLQQNESGVLLFPHQLFR